MADWIRRGGLVLALALTSCGGPLSHTVALSQLPEVRRAEVNDPKLATQDAELLRDDAKHAVEVKKQELKDAKTALKEREHDIKIEKAHLEMEQAKADADRGGNEQGAKTKLKLAKIKRDVAEAQVHLDEEELALARAEADLAQAKWIVSLAVYEQEKIDRIDSDDPKLSEKKNKIAQQLQDKKKAEVEAAERVERAEARVDKAKIRLADAADQ